MELFSLATVVLLLLAVVAGWLLLFNKNRNAGAGSPPPSPPSLPIIGHLHLLAGARPLHRSMAAISAQYGPLVGLKLGQVPALIVSSSATAREVLRTHDAVLSARPYTRNAEMFSCGFKDLALTSSSAEHWHPARKLCAEHVLGNRRVHAQASSREAEVALMVEEIKRAALIGVAVDMSKTIYNFTNDIGSRAVMGKFFRDEGRNEYFRYLIGESSAILGGVNLEDYFPWLRWTTDVFTWIGAKARKNFAEWDALLNKIIEEHRGRMSASGVDDDDDDSFVGALLSRQRDGAAEFKLSDDMVKGILKDMFGGGIETSFIVLEWAMAELVKHPSSMAKLQEEVRSLAAAKDAGTGALINSVDLAMTSAVPYLKAVIKETLRLHPPLPLLIPRTSSEECTVGGYRIAKGTMVFVNSWAIGREKDSWDEPEAFRPERFVGNDVDFKGSSFRLIPFGGGRRICPGMHLGLATVELALANLVCHFDWELWDGTPVEELDMVEFPGITARRKTSLVLVPRLPA